MYVFDTSFNLKSKNYNLSFYISPQYRLKTVLTAASCHSDSFLLHAVTCIYQ